MNENNESNENIESNENSEQEPRSRRKILIGLENMAEEIGAAVDEAVGAATGGIKETMTRVRIARDSVVMVRLNKESLEKLDELVESGVANSRSEAAAFMIAEGVKAKKGMFDKIHEKVDEIRQKREELRRLLEDEEGAPSATESTTPENDNQNQ